jgi:hypothetical protein
VPALPAQQPKQLGCREMKRAWWAPPPVRGSGSRATGGVPAGTPAAAAKATGGGTRTPRRRWSPGSRSGERGTGGCCTDRLFGPECNSPRRDRGGRRRGGARERAGGHWAVRAVRVLIDEATGNAASAPRGADAPMTLATTACHAGASCRGGLSSDDGGGGRPGR